MRDSFLPYCRPTLDESDVDRVVASLRRDWLTTGPNVRELERRFEDLTGMAHAVAVNSATAGLHLALVARSVGSGDEVVLPSLSFVAAAHCVHHCGATPVFCDVEPDTLCASVRTIDAVVTPRTRAIITMPYAGRPTALGTIAAYAHGRGIAVIEDAALGVGTLDAGAWPGAESDCAVFSFYATKNVTSAEGGLLVTNDGDLAERVRLLALHGLNRDAWNRYTAGGTWRYDVTEFGFKYNMTDLAAALALAQLEKFEAMQARRAQIARHYCEALSAMPGIEPAALARLGPGDRHSWCVFPILLQGDDDRDAFIASFKDANIGTSVHYIPSHLFSVYADVPVDVPHTDREWRRLVSLPLFPKMRDTDVDDVVDAMHAFADRAPVHAA
ncbi:MAG: DegT/DnrJ/EryC1/StrS family aminotransferase [Candidatus Elarobacter sp.]